MDKEFWKALFMRSIHAVWETAVSTAPATIVVTPAMIEHFNWDSAKGTFFIFMAWMLTALLSGVLSAAKSMKVGMPEVDVCHEMTDEEAEDFIDANDEILDDLYEYEAEENEFDYEYDEEGEA